MPTIGILAYGSLIEDPGPEIEAARLRTEHNVKTPFKIEFARKSRTRGYGPTLVPVAVGGDHVVAQIIVLKEGITEREACDLVWRRETRQIGSFKRYVPSDSSGENTTVVKSAGTLQGIDTVLYTQIAANIQPLNAQELARLAAESVGKAKPGMDGITYLMDALGRGLKTPLSYSYEAEVKRLAGAESLKHALEKLRSRRSCG
jgi:hypothetical protein